VIVDAPPLSSAGEVRSLGRLSDALLVVDSGAANGQGVTAHAMAALMASCTSPVGLVVAR
jgi:hypothetical protein